MEDFIKPPVRMVGEDGNAFAVIGRVSKALKRAGYPDKAKEWQAAAMACESYTALLGLVFDYADVDAEEDAECADNLSHPTDSCPADDDDLGYGDGHDEECCN